MRGACPKRARDGWVGPPEAARLLSDRENLEWRVGKIKAERRMAELGTRQNERITCRPLTQALVPRFVSESQFPKYKTFHTNLKGICGYT